MVALTDDDHCQEVEFDEFGIAGAGAGKHVS